MQLKNHTQMKAIITSIGDGYQSDSSFPFFVSFIDETTSPDSITLQWQDVLLLSSEISAYTTQEITDLIISRVMTKATEESFSLSESDILFTGVNIQPDWNQTDTGKPDFISNKPAISSSMSLNFNPGRSLVTTAGAANGVQVSSTKRVFVNYAVNVSTTATIGGNSDGISIVTGKQI